MAIKDGDFIKGVLGNVVLRVLNGKQVMQRRNPKGSVKQSKNTKWCGKTFGMAVSLASKIRITLGSRILPQADSYLSSRLNGAIYSILLKVRDKTTGLYSFKEDSFEKLVGFNFNPDRSVDHWLRIDPSVHLEDQKLTVDFPELTVPKLLRFADDSERCIMSVSLSLFGLKEGKMVQRCITQQQTLLEPYAPFEATQFNFHVPDGCLYIVTLWLEYHAQTYKGARFTNIPKLYSGYVCEAHIAPGLFIEDNQYIWTNMISF
jgi:hypothetical protein